LCSVRRIIQGSQACGKCGIRRAESVRAVAQPFLFTLSLEGAVSSARCRSYPSDHQEPGFVEDVKITLQRVSVLRGGNYLYFNQGVFRQANGLHGGAGRRGGGEVASVDLVHSGKFIHVLQKDRSLDYVMEI
jgi:hypothetical protein